MLFVCYLTQFSCVGLKNGNTRRKVRTGMNMPGHSVPMRALAKHGGGVL
jgi:hypothetical protein